ncbi:hypothetical protein [Streptomyces sp. NPDC051704]|uniref:hypothetical protein n=1 Tax=Streptomyces sp. NPDC051704 TaxID=3365671 RepID=UPI003794377C
MLRRIVNQPLVEANSLADDCGGRAAAALSAPGGADVIRSAPDSRRVEATKKKEACLP